MSVALDAIAKGRQLRDGGDLRGARALYSEAAATYRSEGDTLAYAHTIRHVADMFQEELKLDEARPLYEEALELYRKDLHTRLLDLANTVRPYALLLERQGERSAALALWTEAKQLYASLRLDAAVAECQTHLGHSQETSDRAARAVPVIKAHDLKRSVQFYTEVLGFAYCWPDMAAMEHGNGVAFLVRNGAELQLSRHAGDGAFGALVRIFVRDVDACFEDFRRRGLDTTLRPESPIHTAPVDQSWGLREFAVADPDGNGLCFCAPVKGS